MTTGPVLLALLVAAAAGAGAVLRFLVDRAVQARHDDGLPVGTLTVNVTGSLLAGVVAGLGINHGLSADVVLVLSAGLAGGYTTLSTWAYETVVLAESGDLARAGLNAFGTVAACVGAAAAGLALTAL